GFQLPPPSNLVVPLNPPFLNMTYGSVYPATFVNFLGFFGPNNQAAVTFNVPPFQSLIGSTISASYVTLDPAYPLGIRHVGNGTATIITGPVPSVSGVTPGTSPIAGGISVTVHGLNFTTGATVKMGTAFATNVNVVDGSTITCTTPAQTLGAKDVVVTNLDTTVGTLLNG